MGQVSDMSWTCPGHAHGHVRPPPPQDKHLDVRASTSRSSASRRRRSRRRSRRSGGGRRVRLRLQPLVLGRVASHLRSQRLCRQLVCIHLHLRCGRRLRRLRAAATTSGSGSATAAARRRPARRLPAPRGLALRTAAGTSPSLRPSLRLSLRRLAGSLSSSLPSPAVEKRAPGARARAEGGEGARVPSPRRDTRAAPLRSLLLGASLLLPHPLLPRLQQERGKAQATGRAFSSLATPPPSPSKL